MRAVIPAPVPGLDLGREYGHHQSPAIRAGGLIFCSGMVAINPQTGEREHGTVTSEARRIFENLKLLLEAAGSSLERIVQVHAMIYDRIEYDVLNRVYRQYVPNAPPARTVMSVQIEAGFKVWPATSEARFQHPAATSVKAGRRRSDSVERSSKSAFSMKPIGYREKIEHEQRRLFGSAAVTLASPLLAWMHPSPPQSKQRCAR